MVDRESSDNYSKEKEGEYKESDEYQTSSEAEMEIDDEFAGQEPALHICNGYVHPDVLPLNQFTIKRAQHAGLGVPLLNFSKEFLTGIDQMQINENTYDELAKIVDLLKDLALPLLKNYGAPDVEIASFVSPDNGLNTVYLSSMHNGIIIVTTDEDDHPIVSDTNSQEIWRYLYGPSKIVENIVSMLIAVAEKHKSVKDDWISSFQKIKNLSQQVERGIHGESRK
jgi:hypothetical protein